MRKRKEPTSSNPLVSFFVAPGEQQVAVDVRQDEWRAQTRKALRRATWQAAGILLIGCALTALALVLIDRYTDTSNPALVAVQLTGLLGGPNLVLWCLYWLFQLFRRRRAIRLRTWQEVPARAMTIHVGPIWWTAIGMKLASGAIWVIFPELPYRKRIRRLVERDGRLLLLVPRSELHLFEPRAFAGASGSPVFADGPSATSDYWHGHWVRKAAGELYPDATLAINKWSTYGLSPIRTAPVPHVDNGGTARVSRLRRC